MAGLARRLQEIAEIEKNLTLHKKIPKGWKADQAKRGTRETSENVPEGRRVRKNDENVLDCKEKRERIWKRIEENIEILKKDEEITTTRGMENRSQDDQKELLSRVENENTPQVDSVPDGGVDKERDKITILCMKDGNPGKTRKNTAA
jgi:hypothetical protein